MDILEQAFMESRSQHWDDLRNWLRIHAKNVNDVVEIIDASESAERDGRIFPDSAAELQNVIKKYRRLQDPYSRHQSVH